MPKPSPAAQAVLDAYRNCRWDCDLAAAIREIAAKYSYEVHGDGWYELVVDASDLYALADEIERT